jgi:formate dehydrogenase maturation protein FdhE
MDRPLALDVDRQERITTSAAGPGAAPVDSAIDRDRAVALRCATTWSRHVVLCGESDAQRLGSWVADVWTTARIESCDTCRGYIKTFDLREAGGVDVVPLVDDVASAALDPWASGRGLQRSTRSLAGV